MNGHERDPQFTRPRGQPLTMEFLQGWNNEGYRIERYGLDPSVFILGEIHRLDSHRAKQLELINIVQPEYLLLEGAEAWIYDPGEKKWTQQKKRKFDKVGNFFDPSLIGFGFLSLAEKIGFKIIGCDLTHAECVDLGKRLLCQLWPEEYQYDKANNIIRKRVSGVKGLFTGLFLPLNELKKDKDILLYRDRHMAKMITRYQRKSTRPIVVILGATHSQAIHQRKLLQRKAFGYVYIDQYGGH